MICRSCTVWLALEGGLCKEGRGTWRSVDERRAGFGSPRTCFDKDEGGEGLASSVLWLRCVVTVMSIVGRPARQRHIAVRLGSGPPYASSLKIFGSVEC